MHSTGEWAREAERYQRLADERRTGPQPKQRAQAVVLLIVAMLIVAAVVLVVILVR